MKNSMLTFVTLIVATFITVSSPAYAEKAVFAGGCFWCMESDFEKLDGVSSVMSGYTGGTIKNPTYKQVSYKETGHYEAVEITYDSNIITYQQLLTHFWKNIDPFDAKGQFCDKGSSYLSAIFPLNEEQRSLANNSKKQITTQLASTKNIATKIIDAKPFYLAEDYHQDYYKKNPKRYSLYRWRCGRDKRLESLWGKKS